MENELNASPQAQPRMDQRFSIADSLAWAHKKRHQLEMGTDQLNNEQDVNNLRKNFRFNSTTRSLLHIL